MFVVRFDNAVKTRSTRTSPCEKELETASEGTHVSLQTHYMKRNQNKIKLKSSFIPIIQTCTSVFLEGSFLATHHPQLCISLCQWEGTWDTEPPTLRKMGFLGNRIKAKKLVIFPCFGFIFHLFVWLLFWWDFLIVVVYLFLLFLTGSLRRLGFSYNLVQRQAFFSSARILFKGRPFETHSKTPR